MWRVFSASAFENCKSLEHITFRGKTKTIDSRAFRETGLKSLNLPDGLETIGDNAFYGIETLSGVLVIPESVTKLVNMLFGQVRMLTMGYRPIFPELELTVQQLYQQGCV